LANIECLRLFEDKLGLQVKDQLDQLDDDIRALKAQRAAIGSLRSGATIKQVARLCSEILASRVQHIASNLSILPFDYSSNLGEDIWKIALRHFPEDLGELKGRLEDVIRLAGGEHAQEQIINEVKEVNRTEINRLRNQLDQFLLSLKTSRKFSALDKVMLGAEAICLLTTAFLAGKWSSDPSGNYEPYIIIVGVVVPLLEIGRRVVKRRAT
jgi:hypothetical protein